MRYATRTLALALLLAGGPSALAQAAPKPASDAASAKPAVDAASPKPAQDVAAPRPRTYYESLPTHTFYLRNANQQADENEIVTAIRQMVAPEDKVFMVPSQSAILMRAPAEDVALAQKILDDLDRPKKTWRLTYTITDMDGDKRLIQTGSSAGVSTMFSYQDVGVTFDATLTSQANGARLLSNIEQSGVADAPAGGAPAPILRDSSLKGAYLLASSKPLVLGTMDIPGSTHHLQIEVLMEPLP